MPILETLSKEMFGFNDSSKWLLAGRISAAVLFAVVCSHAVATATAQTHEDGTRAFKDQDYQTALRIFRPLAERGDVRSQLNLGMMYNNGR